MRRLFDIQRLRQFRRDESGATLVELAIVMPLLLLLMFGFVDFSRLGFTYVMTGKAMDRAVRMAVVVSAPCPGLPKANARDLSNSTDPRFGTACRANGGICFNPGIVSCSLATDHPTAVLIWSEIEGLMPVNATQANIVLAYEYTPDLGFLGGPYTPVVTARIENLDFQFITPLGALAGLAGSTSSGDLGSDFAFPSMSASLPAEALANGEAL